MPAQPADNALALRAEDRNAHEALQQVRAALRGLRFGQITIILQDGVVVQVERTERTRLQRKEKRR